MHLLSLAHWLARKDRKARQEANETYLILVELIKEAWDEQLRSQKRMSSARKAVIAEIRDKGQKLNSIAPDELRRMIESYLEAHPEESVSLRTFACFS